MEAPPLPPKPSRRGRIETWTSAQVVKHFVELGQDNANEVLHNKHVDGPALLLLNETDLREVGLSLGPVRKHLALRRELEAEGDRSRSMSGDPEALCTLGLRYADGLLTDTKEEGQALAFECFASSAAQGNPRAMLCLGMDLMKRGDEAGASPWLQRALATGHPYVQGKCYALGLAGVKKDLKEAIACYLVAAEAGHVGAMYQLGDMYTPGKKNHPYKSFAWFLKAADLGDAESQFRVAMCYKNGIGVFPNPSRVEKYLHLAAEQGHKEARRVLARGKA